MTPTLGKHTVYTERGLNLLLLEYKHNRCYTQFYDEYVVYNLHQS